jgi:hypothetical protein
MIASTDTKGIERDGKLFVSGVEILNVVNPARRNEVQKLTGQVPVWVKETYSMSGGNVLENEVAEKRRLARSAFPDDVEMLPPVGKRQTERIFTAPASPIADGRKMVLGHEFHASLYSAGTRPPVSGCALHFQPDARLTTYGCYEPSGQ